MAISQMRVVGYRSIKDVWLKLRPVNVLIGPNGCGKSNLYRGLYLIAAAASGRLAHVLAEEGGMPSILWAGERTKGAVRLTLEVKIDNLKYTLSCGLPQKEVFQGPNVYPTPFKLDAHIKEEEISVIRAGVKTVLLKRELGTITARDNKGNKVTFPAQLTNNESVLSGLREPHRFPEISALRQEILSWRFYHQFRTDLASPLRRPQPGILTPVLSHDGSDLAAALQTIISIGNGPALYERIEQAFPGAELQINSDNGQFSVGMLMPGFQRPFDCRELSDGTLQYLCLLAALLSPRPPALLALNEPETSIHPDLLDSLGRLIAEAAKHSQLWITTHSRALADHILEYTGASPIELHKINGATNIVGARLSDDDDD